MSSRECSLANDVGTIVLLGYMSLANDVGINIVLLLYMSFVTMSTLVVVQRMLNNDVGINMLLGYMSLVKYMPWPTTRDHRQADLLPLLIPKFQTSISTASTHSGSCFDVPNFAVYS